MRLRRTCGLLIFLSPAVLLAVADADEPQDPLKARNAKLFGIYREHAASYQMTLGPKASPLSLEAEPVFVWENRARVGTPRIQTGGVFVWTLDGRAEVIGTVFSQTVGDRSPTMFHEFHSLSTAQIQAQNKQGVHWSHREGGLTPKPFPKANAPAANRGLRMAQMRQLARRFKGYSLDEQVVWSFETGTQGPFIESGINDPYRFSSEGTIESTE